MTVTAQPSLPPCTSGATILLVEDDARIRFQTANHLRADGHIVVEAESADAAVAILAAADYEVACVFSDIQMPGRLNGIDLARWILGNRPDIPVILTSGNVRLENLEAELQAALTLIPKPYLANAVTTYLRSRISATGPV